MCLLLNFALPDKVSKYLCNTKCELGSDNLEMGRRFLTRNRRHGQNLTAPGWETQLLLFTKVLDHKDCEVRRPVAAEST